MASLKSVINSTITLSSSVETNFTAAILSPNVYVLVVDLFPMLSVDTIILNIYTTTKPSGTEHLSFTKTFVGVQSPPIQYSVPVPVDTEIRCTITASVNGQHSYDWNILSVQ